MQKYAYHSKPGCYAAPCSTMGFYLQRVMGQGTLEKQCCPYPIYTENQCIFTDVHEIKHIETCGNPICTAYHGCCPNEVLVRLRIPLLLQLCSCDTIENGYIEENVPVRLCCTAKDFWKYHCIANACIKPCKNDCCCMHRSSLPLNVQIQVYLLCGCIIHPDSPCPCTDPRPLYPQPSPCCR